MGTWRMRAKFTFARLDDVVSQKEIDSVLSEAVAEVVLVVSHGRVLNVARNARNRALPRASEVRLQGRRTSVLHKKCRGSVQKTTLGLE